MSKKKKKKYQTKSVDLGIPPIVTFGIRRVDNGYVAVRLNITQNGTEETELIAPVPFPQNAFIAAANMLDQYSIEYCQYSREQMAKKVEGL